MRLLFVIIWLTPLSLMAQESHKWLLQGDQAYQDGNLIEAEEAYKKASELDREVKSQFNLGNTVYNQERYDEAIEFYQNAVGRAQNAQQKSDAYYNLGNANFMAQKFDESIKAYKESLKLDPEDLDAKKNLRMAQKLMQMQQQQQQQQQQEGDENNEEQQQEQQQQQQEEQEGDKSDKEQQQEGDENKEEDQQEQQQQEGDQEIDNENEEQSTADGEPSEQGQDLSKEEAARLLEIMEQEDQKVQEKLRRSSGRKNKSEKEW